jgi:hypothetical protein
VLLLLRDEHAPAASPESPCGPQQGVIEEARRRQRERRIRTAIAALAAAAIIAGGTALWLPKGTSSPATPARPGAASRILAVDARTVRAALSLRVTPTLNVGQAGWCVLIELHGRTGGSACGGAPTPSRPILQAQSSAAGGASLETTVVVTDPQVATVLADNTVRVATVSLPGLPYGLRGALIRLPAARSSGAHTTGSLLRLELASPTLKALDPHGHVIPKAASDRVELQAHVRSWAYPATPPNGACELHSTLPGLAALRGQVADTIQPFPGRMVGHAFLPCSTTEYYLHNQPLSATVVIDAARPRARASALPDFNPIPRAPGFFAQGALTARRSATAWLIVGQGSGLALRMRVLRHLTATVKP